MPSKRNHLLSFVDGETLNSSLWKSLIFPSIINYIDHVFLNCNDKSFEISVDIIILWRTINFYNLKFFRNTYRVSKKISNWAVNAYVKLKPTNPGSMVFRDITEKRAVNKMIRLAHDSNLKKLEIIKIYLFVLIWTNNLYNHRLYVHVK